VRDHARGVLGDERQLRNEVLRRANARDERCDLVGVPDECGPNDLRDHRVVYIPLGTGDDLVGHGRRW
jgi:hypothetical protein